MQSYVLCITYKGGANYVFNIFRLKNVVSSTSARFLRERLEPTFVNDSKCSVRF